MNLGSADSVLSGEWRRLSFLVALVCLFSQAPPVAAQGVNPDVTKGPGGVNPVVGLISSSTSANYGNTVTFTASIVPSTCVGPGNYVNFSDNGTYIGSAYWTTTTPNQAVLTTSSLAVGSHTVQVSYPGYTSGSTTCTAQTSNSVTVTVNPDAAAISVSNIPSNATYGGSFTATYSYSGTGSPAESVSSTTPGVCETSGSLVSFVGTGTCSLYASAAASGNYAPATGTAQSLTVGQATSVISWPTPPAITYGTALSTAQLDASATVNGTPVAGGYSYNPPPGTVPAAGNQPLSVTFTPTNTGYSTATGSVTLAVNKATPSISAACSPNSVTYGASFTCTASVSGGATGTVSWTLNGGVWTSGTLSGGAESFSSPDLSPSGVYTVGVTYSGDANNNSTSTTTSLTLLQATPTITISASTTSFVYGTEPTFAVQVSCDSACGNVEFYVDGAVWGPGTLNSSGATGAGGNPFTVGAHTITATYTGNSEYSSASTSIVVTVNPIPTVTTIESSLNPSNYGQSVSFTSLVNTGGATPTGTVNFVNGGTNIGTGSVSTVSTTNLLPYSAGPNMVSGGGTLPSLPSITSPDGSSSTIGFNSQTGDPYLFLSNVPEGPYTFSVWLQAPAGTGPYSVSIYILGNPNAGTTCTVTTVWQRCSLTATTNTTSPGVQVGGGNAPLVYMWGAQFEQSNSTGPYVATNGVAASGSGGIATLTTSSLSGGSNPITAVYSGDANDAGSTSPVLTQVVPQVPPTITWPTPAAVPFGTALSSTQLDATATVNGTPIPGTFTYKPCVGTVLTTAGANPLSVTFTPTDTTDYATVSDTVSLSVLPPIYDTGTVTLTVDNQTAATTNYGPGSTPATVAAGLAAGANLNSFVNVTAVNDTLYLVAKQAGAGTNYGYSIQDTSNNPTVFTQPSFGSASSGDSLDGGANAGTAQETQPIYSWTAINASTPIYDGVGNAINYSDSVMGNWGFIYDSLNRLEAANPSSGSYNGQFLCWAYDSFGNRTAESLQTTACPAYETTLPATVSYVNSSNQPTNTNQPQSAWGIGAGAGYNFNGIFRYYADGGVKQDPLNHYLYDAEGRLCAVRSAKIGNAMIGYLYDADGIRVAKGSISSMSCDPTINHFVTISDYIIGPANEQLTEMDMDPNQGVMAWQHTNIWAGGTLLGTYDADGTHFYLNDPVGTRRAQTDSQGVLEQTCQSLPYGNGETCAPTPTENLFTGKERDAESGLDYFGARYYSSAMGRFSSPDDGSDWDPTNPQSWNLYSYVRNNPLINVDPDGHDCVYLNNAGNGAEEVDQHSSSTECMGDGTSKNPGTGGYWVDGTAQSLGYDPNSNAVALTGYANGQQTSASYGFSDSVTVNGNSNSPQLTTLDISPGTRLPSPYPNNMHFQFQPAATGYSPWQMVKRMFNCWATDDPNRQIAPKAPEPKASTDTVPNSASNLNTVHGSTRGPQLGNPHAAEAMGTAADAAGMFNDVANCAGGH